MLDNPRVEQDRNLIRRMASKDVMALDEFYEHYNRLAFSLVLHIVGNRPDAEDVLLDVFSQVWQESSRYDASWGKPVTWLLTIARTRAISARRSSNRQQLKNEIFEDGRPATQAVSEPDSLILSDIGPAVQKALQELSGQQRVTLEMAYFQGMSHTEIASALRQPLGTVKDRIRTGMAYLRKRLNAHL
jgi:RNA polymerase sigma-70 factor (ECF subfamily)